jgi:ubiquitin-conjugating enzyme E2 W
MESPEVIFVGKNIPVHPHIYTNGHICLDLLYEAWSPAMSVSSLCVSLLSMLSSNTDMSRPEDNDRYVRSAPKSPKDTKWWFHDDKV